MLMLNTMQKQIFHISMYAKFSGIWEITISQIKFNQNKSEK